MTPKTEVALAGNKEVELQAALEQALESIPWAVDDESSEASRFEMALRILTAESNDEILGSGTATLADYAGQEITIIGAQKRIGNKGNQVYLQLVVEDSFEDSGTVLVSTGAFKPVVKVARVAQNNSWPLKATVFVGQAKESGRTFFDLLRIDN